MIKIVIADADLLGCLLDRVAPIASCDLAWRFHTTKFILHEAEKRAPQADKTLNIPDWLTVKSFGRTEISMLVDFSNSRDAYRLSLAESSALYYAKEWRYALTAFDTLITESARSLGITTYFPQQIFNAFYKDRILANTLSSCFQNHDKKMHEQQRDTVPYGLSL